MHRFRIRSFRLDVRVEVDKDPLADLANIFAARAQVRVVSAVEWAGVIRDGVASAPGAHSPRGFFDRLSYQCVTSSNIT